MAWSDAARAAALETRRAHANKTASRKGAVTYSDREHAAWPTPNRGTGAWAFKLTPYGSKGASHTFFTKGAKTYGVAKREAIQLAKRISARRGGKLIGVTKLS